MKKKESGSMDEKSMQAKEQVLMELIQEMQQILGSKMHGDMDSMQKVTVAAPDKDSLEAGLAKAQEMMSPDDPTMEKMEEDSGEDIDGDQEAGEPAEHVANMASDKIEDDEDKKPKKKKLFSMED